MIELFPNNSLYWSERAYARLKLLRLQLAEADLTRAIERGGAPWAHTYRAEARMALKDWSGVLEDVAVAIELEPQFGRPFFLRGAAHAALGDRAEAKLDLERALRLVRPGSPREREVQEYDDELSRRWGDE